MRVATYNVRHGRPWRGFTTNRWLATAISRLDVDVLAVQEVEHRVVRSGFVDQPRLIAGAAGATAHVYAPARRLALVGSDGVALAVRGSIADHRVLRFTSHRGRQDRVALVATAIVDGAPLTVVATHLQNQLEEARGQLAELADVLAELPRPCVLAGDLNLEPDDVAGPLARAGFTVAGGGPSAPAVRASHRIDHIAAAGASIGDVRVHHLPVSDHRAVVAEVVPTAVVTR